MFNGIDCISQIENFNYFYCKITYGTFQRKRKNERKVRTYYLV